MDRGPEADSVFIFGSEKFMERENGSAGSAPAVLSVRGIAHRFRKNRVLTGVTFDGGQGKCIGVIGLNACGKSTLLSILAGIRKPDEGEFVCFGHRMFREKGWFPRLISYVPQENPLIGELSVRDNVRLWTGGTDRDESILDRMQIAELMEKRTADLSEGTRRRLAIACAMAGRRPVLIMDEPASSLDLHQKDVIHRCMREYLRQEGTILLATHDEEEIRSCDVLYYIDGGRASETKAEEAIRRLREGR
jgi:ABC-2 type transport system ATP-binding protein